ncbi:MULTISPECIES: glutamyl-tRNA reductase [Flavobacteriaceae]|uniref:Glutamyl-tRNA reductase n=2 Tax=Flavobacteriaceae TaxID=49546 RepID=A0A4Y8ANZ0_9FLAO|nr:MULTISPECIES: glutamyl-tRNA reductase [Flavobacteriaceae]TEW72140.1 glutamyl-tRNA reductase [Gramella jeungdoensis]GGK56690.1 glutamyl-tRNA reductase [Lutibacter litoralis]
MNQESLPAKFYNVGLSYKKADVKVRGAFSLTKENQKLLLVEAKEKGIEGIFVLSTCNRTEITGFAKHPFELISLLIKYSNGTVEDFINVSNVYKNKDAVRHLFNIATGIDSQILGDYEIVGQLKQSFKLAKKLGTTNAYLERLMNLVLQASKDVKNNTKLSSGTTSVAYAAIQYIIDNVQDYNNKKILVYGLGEIGKNTCKNILEYTSNKNITLVNRTLEKAIGFEQIHNNVAVADFSKLTDEIHATDILIVSTGSNTPTVTKEHLKEGKELLIIDLSMPENVDIAVKSEPGITLINVDELSKITDKTIETRKKQIPLAEKIIDKYKAEFNDWISHRKYVPAVNALKESLQAIQHDEIDFHSKKIKDFNIEHAEFVTNRMIQKITTQFVKHLKDDETSVDQSINVISKIFYSEKTEI